MELDGWCTCASRPWEPGMGGGLSCPHHPSTQTTMLSSVKSAHTHTHCPTTLLYPHTHTHTCACVAAACLFKPDIKSNIVLSCLICTRTPDYCRQAASAAALRHRRAGDRYFHVWCNRIGRDYINLTSFPISFHSILVLISNTSSHLLSQLEHERQRTEDNRRHQWHEWCGMSTSCHQER